MEVRITELMKDYIDHEFAPTAAGDISPDRVRAMTMGRLGGGTARRGRKMGRVLLIAAAIVLVLSAAAMAAYQYSLRDLVLTEREDGYVDVSVLGWRDTPEYQAYEEWEAYKQAYDSAHEVPHTDDPDIPVAYLRAGAWSPEMVDALEGILTKYGLVMHDDRSITLPAEGSGIDLDAILPGEGDYGEGYAYADGTMMLEGVHILPDDTALEYQLFSAVKGTFTNIAGGMDSEYEEWAYTAADGTELSLVMGEYTSMIVADMDRAFATLHTVFRNVSDKAALEELADSVRWSALDASQGFTDEYYAAESARRAALAEEMERAYAAEQELKDWMLSEDIIMTHIPESRGLSAADSEDGTAWVEWTYTDYEGEGAIRVKFQRPAGDIRAAFDTMLAQAGDNGVPRTLTDVPVYVRTDTPEGASYVTESQDLTVYVQNGADGSAAALWLDEGKDLIFTLTADPGQLTEEELEAQIAYLLSGGEPYPAVVDPEVVRTRLGTWEPAWLLQGWYQEPEMRFASAMTVDGVWTGRFDESFVNGEVGNIVWFGYGTAEAGGDPYETLREAFGYGDEAWEDPYFIFTETTVNGHPAMLKELNDRTTSPVLLWLDEEAGVLFTLSSGASPDAETVRAIAESVTLR